MTKERYYLDSVDRSIDASKVDNKVEAAFVISYKNIVSLIRLIVSSRSCDYSKSSDISNRSCTGADLEKNLGGWHLTKGTN